MKAGRIVLHYVHSRHLSHAGVAARTARAQLVEGEANWMVVGPLKALGDTPEHAGYDLLFYCALLTDGTISVSYAMPRKDGSFYAARNCPFDGVPGF